MRIIANSLPKSGTHLLVRFLELLEFKEYEKGLTGAMVRPTQRNPFKRYLTNQKRCLNQNSNGFSIDLDNMYNKIQQKYLDKYLDTVKNNYFISAHIPYTKELDDYLLKQDFKMLYIIRDPRDVLLSYYNHQNRDPHYPFHSYFKDKTFKESYKKILEGMTKGETILASLKNRIHQSQGWINSKNVFSLKFEELIGEKGGGDKELQLETIKNLLNFLEIDFDDEKVYYLSQNIFYPKAETFHKGQIYRWKEEYADEIKDEVNEYLKDFLMGLNYE